jgi:hypothetical protein
MSGLHRNPVRNLPWLTAKDGGEVQRVIEMLIGRLITDEQFRAQFLGNPEQTLAELCERGMELSGTEVAALLNTDPTLWARTADAVDPRLQKASLKNELKVSS